MMAHDNPSHPHTVILFGIGDVCCVFSQPHDDPLGKMWVEGFADLGWPGDMHLQL